jgi:uncharacterized membrane protein YdjX (TVP38/TMEM64 family)
MEPAVRRQLLGGLALAALAVVGLLVLSPERALRGVVALGERPLVFLGLLVVVYGVRSLVLWPISALSILVGFVLGVPGGVPVALAGAVYTCLPPYLLARYAPDGGGPLDRIRRLGRRVVDSTGDLRGLAAARLLPLPADPVSYAAGLAGVSLPAYVAGTALGEFPWVVAAVTAGASMRTFTLSGSTNSLALIAGAAGLGVLLLAGPVYRRVSGTDPLVR